MIGVELVPYASAVAAAEPVSASAIKRLEDDKLAFYDEERHAHHLQIHHPHLHAVLCFVLKPL